MKNVTGQVERTAVGGGDVLYTDAKGQTWHLPGDEVTKAYNRYARQHNEYQRTVRQNTDLRRAALREYVEANR